MKNNGITLVSVLGVAVALMLIAPLLLALKLRQLIQNCKYSVALLQCTDRDGTP